MNLTIDRWDEHRFDRVLKDTLSQYPTGKEVELEEVAEYHRTIPKHKIVPEAFEEARNQGRTLLNPRAGVAGLQEMIDLLLTLQDAGGADLLPINPDSYTRTEQFEKAKAGLEDSTRLRSYRSASVSRRTLALHEYSTSESSISRSDHGSRSSSLWNGNFVAHSTEHQEDSTRPLIDDRDGMAASFLDQLGGAPRPPAVKAATQQHVHAALVVRLLGQRLVSAHTKSQKRAIR